jgi:hypothetical protein
MIHFLLISSSDNSSLTPSTSAQFIFISLFLKTYKSCSLTVQTSLALSHGVARVSKGKFAKNPY